MVCNLIEGGRSKCHQYWPSKVKKQFTNHTISLIEEEILDDKYLMKRTFMLKNKKENSQEEKIITQLHFTGWPDHGVPEADEIYTPFIDMFNTTKEFLKVSPIVVHCSAGVGRTGTFISSFNIWNQIESRKAELLKGDDTNKYSFSVFDTVRSVKECRCYSVENKKQYKFIYQLIYKHLKSLL